MKLSHKIKYSLAVFLAAFIAVLTINVSQCSAARLAFSPMRQEKILVPGTTDYITVTLSVPSDVTETVDYELEVRPFSVDDNNITHFNALDNYSNIVDWVELPNTSGSINPNEREEIVMTVNVPEDAPSGGQYFALIIKTDDGNDSGIKQVYEMAHPVFAEVAGETIRQGEIDSLEVPSLLLSGDLTGSASVKNLGNIHSNVKHVLKVFPLIGNEEYFTNEESAQENVVMPGATRFSSISWENTPSVGIFRVEYSVEFEGVKKELNKIVIACPIWLMAVIAALILVIIYKIVSGILRKNKATFKPAE